MRYKPNQQFAETILMDSFKFLLIAALAVTASTADENEQSKAKRSLLSTGVSLDGGSLSSAENGFHLSHGSGYLSSFGSGLGLGNGLSLGGLGLGSSLGGLGSVGYIGGLGSLGVGALSGLNGGFGRFSVSSVPVSVNTVNTAIPVNVPQPIPVTITRPVAVPVPHAVPVPVPRPVPVAVPQAVPVSIPRPYPVDVPKPQAVPVPHPVPVSVPHPVPVSVPQPYPVTVTKPVPVSVPTAVFSSQPVAVSNSPSSFVGGLSYGSISGGSGLTFSSSNRDLGLYGLGSADGSAVSYGSGGSSSELSYGGESHSSSLSSNSVHSNDWSPSYSSGWKPLHH